MRTLPLLALALGGCASSDPTWALDVGFVVPEGSGVTGSVTWQVYRKAWQRKFADRHYLCAVLTTFDGTPTTPDCPDCVAAMEVTLAVEDSDCDDALTANPTFVSITRIGFGPVGAGGPYPGESSTGYVDYGPGWEVHGWAYPDRLTQGETPDTLEWDGTQPFSMAPTFAWQLGDDPGTAAMSRFGVDDDAPGGA
ncbi:MAG: hypothetical protein H6737_18005 [Alphaproteobacteria bacterium]|nr:hypothetical protein [Alphaproteobacteria bacterium]